MNVFELIREGVDLVAGFFGHPRPAFFRLLAGGTRQDLGSTADAPRWKLVQKAFLDVMPRPRTSPSRVAEPTSSLRRLFPTLLGHSKRVVDQESRAKTNASSTLRSGGGPDQAPNQATNRCRGRKDILMLPDPYPPIHQAYRLFEALHAPLHDGEQGELRWSSPCTRGSMRRKFFASTEATAREAVSLARFCDVYFGVAPRRGSDGTRAGVRRLAALWADLDAKDEHTVDSRLRQLQTLTCPPSILVLTGGGCHAYWLLKNPVDGLERLEQAEAVMRRLGQGLGGDPVWDRARILRVPGTFNHKYDAPRPVDLERCEPGLRYELDQLEEMAKTFPEEGAHDGVPSGAPSAGRSSVRRDVLAASIREGERNVTLASVAGSLRDRGLDEGLSPLFSRRLTTSGASLRWRGRRCSGSPGP